MKDFFVNALDYLRRTFMAVAAPFGILLLSFTELSNLIGFLVIKATSATFGFIGIETDFTSISGLDWSVINAIIPLAEIWTMLILFLTFMSAILVFRWIKSIIPTIAN